MKHLFLKTIISVTLLSMFVLTGFAQAMDEPTLAYEQSKGIFSNYHVIKGTKESEFANKVFQTLLNTNTVRSGRSLDYKVFLIDDQEVNAFSTAAGQVYLTQGITPVLGDDFGVWATVLGHEIGHQMAAHHYKAYVRKMQVQATKQLIGSLMGGANGANMQVLAGMGGALINQKLSRNDEMEADRLAMQMIAEAGVHPDFAITGFRRMQARGDQSKLEAFFASHPRWATREENLLKAYNDALTVFCANYPDAAKSPGGAPPVVATLGEVKVSKDDKAKEAVITFPYNVRNAKAATINVLFAHKGKAVAGVVPEFQFEDGAFGIVRAAQTSASPNQESFSIRIPAAALNGKDRKLSTIVQIVAEGEIVAASQSFKINIPKP